MDIVEEELQITVGFVKATTNTSAKITEMSIANTGTVIIRTC